MSRELPGSDLEVLLSAEQIASRVKELAAQISAYYRGRPLHLIGMLKGAWVFLADLVRHLDLEVTVDFLSRHGQSLHTQRNRLQGLRPQYHPNPCNQKQSALKSKISQPDLGQHQSAFPVDGPAGIC